MEFQCRDFLLLPLYIYRYMIELQCESLILLALNNDRYIIGF